MRRESAVAYPGKTASTPSGALQTRLRQGKDLLDILNLVSLCKINIEGQEFQGVLDRYANEEIRNLVLRFIR